MNIPLNKQQVKLTMQNYWWLYKPN